MDNPHGAWRLQSIDTAIPDSDSIARLGIGQDHQKVPDNPNRESANVHWEVNSIASAASSMASERARLAELQARASYMKHKHALDRQAQELKAKQ